MKQPTDAQLDVLRALADGGKLRRYACPEGANPSTYPKMAFLAYAGTQREVQSRTTDVLLRERWIEELATERGDVSYRLTNAGRVRAGHLTAAGSSGR